jgi:MYXO-CTERM domain-containing protein
MVVVSDTSITATTPAGLAGAQDVVVTTAGGTGQGTGLFTYIPAPTVSSVSPNNGPAAGGTSIIISGTDFTNATAVTLGGNAVSALTVLDATSISATTPAGISGPQDVVVTTAGGTGIGAGLFNYVAAPSVSGISPSSGPTAGGTVVTISGANLLGASSVTIGGNPALNVTVTSASTVTATTPAGLAGARDVVVATPGGLAAAAGIFTYVAPALVPTVTAVQPDTGPESGGTIVTITGTNFASPATVIVGGSAATSVAVNSPTSITATTPAGVAGAQDVLVTTGGGTGTGAGLFTYATPDAGMDADAGLSDDAGLLADAAVLDAAVDLDAGAADAASAVDAGTLDGGSAADAAVQHDAGTPAPDGGMTTRDAGMTGADASVPMGDGGVVVTADAGAQGGGGDADSPSGGCGCESSNPADVSGPAWALLAAMGLLSTRKRILPRSR